MTIKIAITGELRSGKDTVADIIKKVSTEWDSPLYSMRFARGIEQVIHSYFPEALTGGNKPRRHYQHIGQSFRTLNPDIWVEMLEEEYQLLRSVGKNNFIVTDLRQPNEYKWLKDNGFTVIKVGADYMTRVNRVVDSGDVYVADSFLHETETAIKELPYDFFISNNGTLSQLKVETTTVLNSILKDGGK